MGFFDDEHGTNSYWIKVILLVVIVGLIQWGIRTYKKRHK
jgi:hypothetical protein